jgi:polar amino acid transport system substrate-binding protein
VSTLVLSGCGSSSTSSSATSSTTSSQSTIPVQGVDPAAAALLPASIRTAGTIRFITAPGLPPGESLEGQPPRLVGLDIDLGTALAQVLGSKATFRQSTFDTIIPSVSAGTAEAGLSSIFDTPAREQLVTMVDYLSAGQSFFVASGGPTQLDGLTALCGKSVAVLAGSVEQQELVTQNAACASSGSTSIAIRSYGTQPAATQAVRNHTAQVGFADQPIVESLVASSGGALVISGTPFNVVPYGIATAKDAPLAKAFAAALDVLIKNGTYSQILHRWGTTAEAVSSATINGATNPST